MATSSLHFEPEDFDPILLRSELEEVIETIVIAIRQSTGFKNNKLLQLINQMQEYYAKDLKKESVQTIFTIYKTIIAISIEMRQLLSEKIQIENYDNIAYAFYIDGERYSTDTLNADWLTVHGNGLFINLNKAKEELKDSLEKSGKSKIAEIFNQHYTSYLAAITGMYKGIMGGRGSRLNKGHIAEAYEAHIAEHHSQAYQLLNAVSVLDKMVQINELEEKGADYWKMHEEPNSAWIHIRGALGNQRGTVAGDVGKYQVKQVADGASQLRLSSLANLETGIKSYCMITNPDVPPRAVAHRLAIYMSEVVSIKTQGAQAWLANKKLTNEILKLTKDRIVHI